MLKKLILILLLTPVCHAAQVIRYVDPDAVGGGTGVDWANAYTALQTWNQAEKTDLVSAGNIHTVYCRSSSGTDDTTPVSLLVGDWTTASGNYIEIIGADFPSDGIFDGTKYNLNITNAYGFASNVQYVTIRNMQFQLNTTGTTSVLFFSFYAGSTSAVIMDSCIIKGVCSGTGLVGGISGWSSDTTLHCHNTLIYGFVSGGDNSHYGVWVNDATCYFLNCTIYGNYYGIDEVAGGSFEAHNTISGNNTDDFRGNMVIDYCCTDDADGTNGQGPSGGNWANEFTTPGSDFSLLVGGNCVENGTDDPGSGLYSDDIVGLARTSTWDIGVFEYDNIPVGGGGQVIWINEN